MPTQGEERSSYLVMKPIIARLYCILVLAVAFLTTPHGGAEQALAQSGERITDYKVAISVQQDRSVDIVETITINVQGNVFKRGLLRDVPVRYRGKHGETVYIDLKVHDIQRDGRPEPYQLTHQGRYARLRIGNANVFLQHGLHTYVIRYSVEDSIGFFEDFDEIYWNAIGDEWPFPIDKAKVSVLLPEGATILQKAFYTGRTGSQGANYTLVDESARHVTVETKRLLSLGEGLTVAVGWQKGIVDAPTEAEIMQSRISDNSPMVILLLAALAQMGWLYFAWNKVGRDPEGGAIIPRFRAPDDVSPAIASYVSGLGSFTKSQQASFMAALVDLAIKGFVEIDNKDDDDVTVLKTGKGKTAKLPAGQKALYNKLFATRTKATFSDFTYETMSGIMSAFTDAVNEETDQVYFRRNTGYMVPGFLLAILGLVGYCAASILLAPPYTLPLIELAIAGTVAAILVALYGLWRVVTRKKSGSAAILIPFFFIVFFGVMIPAEVENGTLSLGNINWLASVLLIAMGLALFFFSGWMKAPTKLGREVLDEVEGLRLFMTVTVAEQADHADMPELTPQLYEDLLPYAIGLGVEKKWSKVFEDKVFSQLPPDRSYRPHWYHGHFNPSRPTASLAAMTSTLGTNLASAMTPPASSSSGSSGGGFSGGGGGGGGGGGW